MRVGGGGVWGGCRLARALVARRGYYANPAARQAAAGLLPQPVLTHAALLEALARFDLGVAADQVAFAAWLTAAEPEAAPTSPRSSPAPPGRPREHGRTDAAPVLLLEVS